MVIDSDIEKVRSHLNKHDYATIDIYGIDIRLRALEDASKVFLTTSVYSGHTYLPFSIRSCLKNSKQTPFDQSSLATFVNVDEAQFDVSLNYIGDYELLPLETFKSVLEEFAHQAIEWRLYLDEKDRHDRVHARSRL